VLGRSFPEMINGTCDGGGLGDSLTSGLPAQVQIVDPDSTRLTSLSMPVGKPAPPPVDIQDNSFTIDDSDVRRTGIDDGLDGG
jgi:hypothetical protein